MSKREPLFPGQHIGLPRHRRSPEFAEYLRKKSAEGGRSRSLAKIDASVRNGSKNSPNKKKLGPKGPHLLVPPLNALEVGCAARCGFTMLLSRNAMEANTRGKAITLTCPDCGVFGTILEARMSPAPIMPERPAEMRNDVKP